jgi:hypothetical protein
MNRRTFAALAGALLLLTACVEDSGPDAEACAAPAVEIELALSAAALEPDDPAVCRDQEVTLIISPEVDGVFHIHGYDEEVPATEVRSGEVSELRFTAARSGQFPIELHPLDNPAGVDIGFFTVHEP